jgi:SAM-dependent methyltransferase
MKQYDAEAYWHDLLSGSFNLRGVSWPELSVGFLQWQYRARREALRRVVPHARGLRVLDVGPGTGHWVAFWYGLGATSVAGVDLTETSVQHLREQFPGDHFTQGDISQSIPPGGPFDLISAIDVLLHITDNDRYAEALANLRRVAQPGTRLVLLEPLSLGPALPFAEGQSSRARSLSMARALLARSGWRVRAVQPALWLLTNPIEIRPARVFQALMGLWQWLERMTQEDRRGSLLGGILYPLDRALCRLPWGPSSRVVLAEAY